MAENLTGYGSSASRFARLLFDGEERNYEKWEIKFLGYMHIHKLKDIILSESEEVDASRNELAFSELIQFLDDRSLCLIMRDAKNDGRKALKLLRSH